MNQVAKHILRERLREKIFILPIILAAIESNTGQNTDARLAALSIMVFPGDEDKDNLVELEFITKPQEYSNKCATAAVEVACPDHGH
jgi:hypothetical protein